MTEHTTTLDTAVAEPSPTAGEAGTLVFALDRSRATLAWKCGGLDAAGLFRAHPPTTMTLGGLLKHLAFVDDWTAVRLAAAPMPDPWRAVDWEATPDWPWTSAADDTPEELFRLWRAAGARCRAAVDAVLAEGGLDQQAKFDFPGNELPTARRLLVDLHDEYARHVGHADLLREAVDGLVGEDPPQG
jgi:Protein of unknown function (DUF664)